MKFSVPVLVPFSGKGTGVESDPSIVTKPVSPLPEPPITSTRPLTVNAGLNVTIILLGLPTRLEQVV